ncbi:hypothetical protein ACHAXT_013060 [Thalassiosira profunda]
MMSLRPLAAPTALLALLIGCRSVQSFAPYGSRFSSVTRHVSSTSTSDDVAASDGATDEECEVLLLDHLNINHEKGRQDALKSFYFDFLGCAIDPRKYDENYVAGKKINSFLDGEDERFAPLRETEFLVGVVDDMMMINDPWGSQFCILPSDDPVEDRAAGEGAQPVMEGHSPSEGLAMEDLTVYVEHGSNLAGIGRFYETVLGAPTIDEGDQSISVAMGERQTLTFQYHPDGKDAKVEHHDLSFAEPADEDAEAALPVYPSNHGPHISLYVTNLSRAYKAADALGVLYVNPRFKRRAYTMDEAIDQCMFRLIDIVDPLDTEGRVIVKLEHEVRSAKTRDGSKYKSCPLLKV